MQPRFQDSNALIDEFTDKFLVHCPQCQKCAVVITNKVQKNKRFSEARVSCAGCGYNREWDGKVLTIGGNVDWCFKLPLWLQTPCCGEVLWAYNEEHLTYLENFVAAKLRERKGYISHSSVITRLPGWLKTAKNRDEILKCITKLRATIKQ